MDGGEIKVFAPLGDDSVDNFEYSSDRKFNPTLGELMTVNSFHIYMVLPLSAAQGTGIGPRWTTAPMILRLRADARRHKAVVHGY